MLTLEPCTATGLLEAMVLARSKAPSISCFRSRNIRLKCDSHHNISQKFTTAVPKSDRSKVVGNIQHTFSSSSVFQARPRGFTILGEIFAYVTIF